MVAGSPLARHPERVSFIDAHSFIDTGPRRESAWRGVVLLGRNVQAYKFALAQSLLELASKPGPEIRLEELAAPFSAALCSHLRRADKQGTPASSRFLDTLRAFNRGEADHDRVIEDTVRLGFNNVLNAFHVVSSSTVPFRFFNVTGTGTGRRVSPTDEIFELAASTQRTNLEAEIEARWGLVETAWELGVEVRAIAPTVSLDRETQGLVAGGPWRRRSLTGAYGAIGGYQKGRCFYCGREVSSDGDVAVRGDVDHFLPWSLGHVILKDALNLDGIWNLVIACRDCNRGEAGKFAMLPSLAMLGRLHARNEFYILSHHPLREALIAQTGASVDERRRFLNAAWQVARDHALPIWEPVVREEPAF